jgi:GNAT superfamily N-acetyltransferase
MNIPSQTKIHVRHLTIDDYDDIHDVMVRAYAAIGGHPWQKQQIARLLELFPAGQIGVEVNGRVVGAVLTLIVDYKKFGDSHTYRQITGNHSFDTHDPKGDVLYGIDIFIDPDYRGLRLGRRLYYARKELCEKLNLSAIVAGGAHPGLCQIRQPDDPQGVHREGAPERAL